MSKSIKPSGATLPDEHYKAATMKWVDSIVIKHNFCPFARFVRTPNQIRCEVVYGDAGVILETLYNELTHLDSSTDTATTLLILPAPALADFEEYLDILSIAEHMLQEWGYVGTYQLASFHPNYVFDGNTDDDAENFTNRSPYPVLHLIRESDISRYMKNEDDAEKIYTHNIQKANELGCPYFKETLSTIKRTGLPNGKP